MNLIQNINIEFKGNESLSLASSKENGPGIDENKLEISDLNQFSHLVAKAVNLFVDSKYNLKELDEYETKLDDAYEQDMIDMGNAIALFWKLPAIRNTFNCRYGNFSIADNLDYFFNKAQKIFDKHYILTDQDILRMYVATRGMTSCQHLISDSAGRYTLDIKVNAKNGYIVLKG